MSGGWLRRKSGEGESIFVDGVLSCRCFEAFGRVS